MPFVGSLIKKGNLPISTAYEDEANIFTFPQKVKHSAVSNILALYRNGVDANGSTVGIDLSLDNLAHQEKVYAQVLGAIEDSTTSSEKGSIILKILHTGALRNAFKINNDGTIEWGLPTSPYAKFSPAGLSAQHTYTFPNADTAMVGADAVNIFSQHQTFQSYLDFPESAIPASPASGTRRLFNSGSTHELSVRASTGEVFSLEQPGVGGGGGGGGGGEINTGANVGTAGIGVFDGKVTTELQFRKLNSLTNKLTIALDTPNQKVDFNIVEANFALANLAGTLAIGKGGTGQTTANAAFDALSGMTTLGDLIYGGASGVRSRLAGSTNAAKRFLSQQGNGTVSAAPAWSAIADGDLSSNVPLKNANNIMTGHEFQDNYHEIKIIAAPGIDPTTGYIMDFAKVVDSNNDTFVLKQRVGGVIMEVYG